MPLGQVPLHQVGENYQLPLLEAVFLAVAVLVAGFMLKLGLFRVDSRRNR